MSTIYNTHMIGMLKRAEKTGQKKYLKKLPSFSMMADAKK